MLAVAAVSLSLVAPVPGPVARGFAYGPNPFRAGWHRGADFAAPPGAAVRAACTGRVAWARGTVITLRCGAFRVTHLPLATITVAPGARVTAGTPVGTLGRDTRHMGLHLGVRRASDRFAYIDPIPLIARTRHPVPLTPAPRRRERPRGAPRTVPRPAPRRTLRPAPRLAAPRHAVPHSVPTPAAPRLAAPRHAVPHSVPTPVAPRLAAPRHAVPHGVPTPAAPRLAAPRHTGRHGAARPGASRSPSGFAPPANHGVRVLAPWPAWLGLAILLLGAVGRGVRIGRRRRRAEAAAVARDAVA